MNHVASAGYLNLLANYIDFIFRSVITVISALHITLSPDEKLIQPILERLSSDMLTHI